VLKGENIMNQRFELFINKEIKPKEFSELMASVGWGLI